MTILENLTVAQLRKVVAIKERIEQLQSELESIAGNGSATTANTPKKRHMSASARARIAAAQKARWAKVKGKATKAPKDASTKRRKMSPATKARLAAIAKARWAKVKASGKSAL
jgi:hypothetical protein